MSEPRPPGWTAAAPPPDPPDRSGIDEAFSAFYRESFARLVAFLLWHGARLPDAADIAQDTMIKAFQNWSTIDWPEAWARRVASRELVRRVASVSEDLRPNPPEPPILPKATDVEAWVQRHEILRLVADLPPRQKQVMAWTLDEYTPAEIARELGITPEAVRANLKKARLNLTRYLSEAGEEQ